MWLFLLHSGRGSLALLHLHHIYDSQDHRFHAARGSSGHGVVVERVIEKSVMEITYPVLTRTNYSEWSLVMRVNLQAASLWDDIEDDTTDYREDRNALAALLRAVLEEMQVRLARNESASDASAPTARPGAASGPPRVLRPQLPLPGPGQLRGHHVSCGLSSRCPARGSSGAATCHAASAPAAQPGAALGPL
jgi:hypothetical protein